MVSICDWQSNLLSLQANLQNWSKEEFGSLSRSILRNQQKLSCILKDPVRRNNFDAVKEIETELNLLLDLEAELWRQRAKISNEVNQDLYSIYTAIEVKEALSQMHPNKATGPDGLGALFFQKYWHLVSDKVFSVVLNILNGGNFPDQFNHATIVLIPKVKNPVNMSDFRPINLCNVTYKLRAKCIVNRLKKWLPDLISECQSAFVAGRSIHDNLVLAFELIHSLKVQKKGKVGHIAAKLDIKKAYDKLEWDYIRSCLRNLGFKEDWISLVMKCVTSVIPQL